ATSYARGRNGFYALDECLLTWWQPEYNDSEPCHCMDLTADYTCEAVRIVWRDINMDVKNGIVPGPYKYVVEQRLMVGSGEWETVLDMSKNTEDRNIDYKTFPPALCREVRLRITEWPKGITPGVVSFTLFGKMK
ncbi:MAG: hypothetical protein Q4G23_09670, partial [Clostridia bacterium]|nr:hypothetical protein [Clostridia bacterium]